MILVSDVTNFSKRCFTEELGAQSKIFGEPFLHAVGLYGMGHAVEKLVDALCYKSEGRGFDSQWCHWNFSLK
jgi:hypothetical protein